MRWSNYFIPTLKEAPADAEVISHKLLVRAGFVRQVAAGIYSYLPLAQRTLLKIAEIIRQEMNRAGAQEFYLPALHPAELWIESGRWEVMGENMFRLKDRSDRDLCLGMTHEEVFADIARRELRSYRDLPQIWYQIQVKFRDEPRPKGGMLRLRQFIMKDSYSFDRDWEGLDLSYEKHREAYCRIYQRCGLEFTVVEAHSGAMGGQRSQEFMVRTDAGEDLIATCPGCGYAANLERAISLLPAVEDNEQAQRPELVHTPGQKTIDEVSRYLGVPPDRLIKSLVYIAGPNGGAETSRPVLALVRGDHELNEAKLTSALAGAPFRPAHPDEIKELFGAEAGSIGPVDAPSSIRIIADQALQGRRNMIAGANRNDYHLKGISPGISFRAEYYDLRTVRAGEACVRCGAPLEVYKALEIGHIFKLGTKYSEAMGARILTEEGKQVPIVMGSYGIGLERIMAAAVELYHDQDGIIWPMSIAPFQVIVTPVSTGDQQIMDQAEKIYRELADAGIEALLDDRNERPGVKFKDADLIGIPLRVTIGQKLKESGIVELFHRRKRRTHMLSPEKVRSRVRSIVNRELRSLQPRE